MIEFRLLGTLHLIDAAGREVKSLLTRPRRLALLAYLAAATPRGLHRRDSLLALFWPELDQEHARAALRQALHVVRDALGADVIVTRGDEEVALDFDLMWCDVVAFDRAVAAEQFSEALDLYRGDLLEGFFIPDAGEFEHWQESERARLQQAAARGAQTLVQRCETEGDLSTAAEWARRAVRRSPHDEEPLRRLIALLDRLGDRAGAVEAYEDFAKRLAVLPLTNLSGDSLESWYADGLTEALTTDLGRLRVVRVVSRDAAARYKGKRLPDIARGLEVDAVVEGGLQVSGGRVRVDLRLVDAASGYQLWADRFEEPVDKRFALEDRSASGILSALKLPLSSAEQRGLRAAPTQNLQAYDFYLRGRIRVRHESRQDNPVAIDLKILRWSRAEATLLG